MKKLDDAQQERQYQLKLKKLELEIKKVELKKASLQHQQVQQTISDKDEEEVISPGESHQFLPDDERYDSKGS